MRISLQRLLPGSKLFTFILATAMIYSVIASIIAADWAEGMGRLMGVMLMALLVGTIFANLAWLPGWLAHLLSLVLGTVWSISAMAPLLGPGLPRWSDQASEVLLRLIFWVRTLERGVPGEDLVLFIAIMAVVTWWLAYATVWVLFRRGWPWVAVVLNALVILINLTWALPKPTGLFFFFLLSALLLLVYENFRWRQLRWTSVGLEEQEFLSLRFIWTGVIVCTGLILMTALLPTSISSAQVERVWVQVKRPFDAVQTSFDQAFSNINGPGVSQPNIVTFSRTGVGLGGARTASNDVIMTVVTSRPDYWRANAFDLYDPDDPLKWRNTTGEIARSVLNEDSLEEALTYVEPDQTLPQTDLEGREPVTQTITIRKNRGDNQLPTATQPYSYSLPVLVEHSFITSSNDGAPLPNFADTSIVYSPQPVSAGMTYTAVSMVSTVDKASLRAAGGNYPAWTQRYLQLPDTVEMQKIRALAQEIAAGADNPYDQASAIENYLRQFLYNDQIPAPPAGRDPVEWFLFELQEGYCDYYASSMVLMMRSLGVPARWVQGYATGEYDEEVKAYVVRDVVAHSWPELYFPGYGWQRFEPTPAGYVTVPDRPEQSPDSAEDPNAPNSQNNPDMPESLRDIEERNSIDLLLLEEQLNQQFGNPDPTERQTDLAFPEEQQTSWIRRGAPFVLALLLVTALLLMLSMRREVRGLAPAAAAYARLSQLAQWAGVRQRATATPMEYGDEVARRFPEHEQPIRRIAATYSRERYGKGSGEGNMQDDLRTVQWPLLRGILRRLASGDFTRRRR